MKITQSDTYTYFEGEMADLHLEVSKGRFYITIKPHADEDVELDFNYDAMMLVKHELNRLTRKMTPLD